MSTSNNNLIETPLSQSVTLTGSCLCGGVGYFISGTVRDVVNCFCQQCQKTSGHYVAATRVNKQVFKLEHSETLAWYESSPGIQRGFCRQCGSSLFWDDGKNNQLSVMAGTIDPPTGLKTVRNIFVAGASDYCDIPHL